MEERLPYLFRKYLQNTISPKELQEFFSYIRQAKYDEFLQELIKDMYGEIRNNAPTFTYVNESGNLVLTNKQSWPAFSTPKKKTRVKKVIAGFVVLAGITVGVIFFTHRLPTAPSVLANASQHIERRGKNSEAPAYRSITLPDGTTVLLNEGSTLDYPVHFAKNKREVSLHGEGFFDVKHLETSSFIIHTGEISTTVLGTAFNIKAYPGQKNITVSVSRGKVRVSRGDKPVAVLTKGQQAKISSRDNEIVEKPIPVAAVAAWQTGNILYDDERFEDVVSDIERMYRVSISITDIPVKNLKISTSFLREIGAEQALQILCKLTDTALRERDGGYIIQ